jgi:hypothetical protein
MMYLDERTMGHMIDARHESLAELMAASHRRNPLVTRLGVALIWLGQKLRQECPSAEELMSIHRRPRPHPRLT